MRAPASRGQATTELALGSLVFVTILLFGIHFSEAGFAMLKAKEAAAFAMHDATGRRTHMFDLATVSSGNTFGPFNPAPAGAAAAAKYASGWQGVLTQVSGVRVACQPDNTVRFGVRPPAFAMTAEASSALAYLQGIDRDRGGVACRSKGIMSLFGVPSSFAEGSTGFFKAPHARYTDISVCGAGMPTGGACTGELATLSGDWAFEDQPGSPVNGDVQDSRLGVVVNKGYEQVVRELFDRSGGQYSDSTTETPAMRMMRIAAGITRADTEFLDETKFSMSYRGELGGGATPRVLEHQVFPMYNAQLKYQTTGADLDNSGVLWDKPSGRLKGVPRCFMSMYGCPAHQTNPN